MAGKGLFQNFNDALTKQYKFPQLKSMGDIDIYYWIAECGISQVDFVADNGKDIYTY